MDNKTQIKPEIKKIQTTEENNKLQISQIIEEKEIPQNYEKKYLSIFLI